MLSAIFSESNGHIIGFWMVQSYKHAIWFHENRYGSDYHKELSMPYFGLYFWILYSITKILSLNFKPTMLFQYWHIWSWCFYCEACSLVNLVQRCMKRVENDDSGQKHCTGQYFDYWSCVDKSVRNTLGWIITDSHSWRFISLWAIHYQICRTGCSKALW